MEKTTLSKAEKFMENMLVSMAIQEAINQKAIYPSKEERKMINELIAQIAQSFKPAEA